MNEEYKDQVAESDGFEEETYIGSIGMLEYLIKPGKNYGQCRLHLPYRILIIASRDANLFWKRTPSWKR
jgi:hypothetical protein